MGLKRVTKKFLKYLIPTLLVLLIIPISEINRKSNESKDIFGEGPIRCAIKLKDKLSDGYQTGYCYEMMERLAASLKDSTEIFMAEEDGVYLDSLRLDSLGILAVPTVEVPESDEFMSFPLGDVPISWVIKSDKRRQEEIIRWLNNFKGTNEYACMLTRFFHGYNPYRKGVRKDHAIISPYDDLIKENAKKIGWNWKMFAALIWSESRFRIQARSHRGAVGLMQMMPRTANRYEIENLLDPKENIEAGAAYIARLQGKFKDTATDNDELVKFTLAAYNAAGLTDLRLRIALLPGDDHRIHPEKQGDGRHQTAADQEYGQQLIEEAAASPSAPPRRSSPSCHGGSPLQSVSQGEAVSSTRRISAPSAARSSSML